MGRTGYKKLKVDYWRRKLNRRLTNYYRLNQLGALFAIILLAPLMVLLFVGIFLEHLLRDGAILSPVVHQKRLTQGRPFVLYKFRTRLKDESLSVMGHILRKWYLDELPQLFNIFRGEMLFVGPRPHPPKEYRMVHDSGFQSKRILYAGLTGGVQAAKGGERNGDLFLDEEYLHFCVKSSFSQILYNDLLFIWNTMIVVFKAEGLHFGG